MDVRVIPKPKKTFDSSGFTVHLLGNGWSWNDMELLMKDEDHGGIYTASFTNNDYELNDFSYYVDNSNNYWGLYRKSADATYSGYDYENLMKSASVPFVDGYYNQKDKDETSLYRAETIAFPETINHIGYGLELFDNLKSITVNSQNADYSASTGVLYDKRKTIIIFFPPKREGRYTVPSTVTSLDSNVFYGSTGLSALVIPASVSDISAGGFDGCPNIKSYSVDSGNRYYSSLDGVLFDKNKTGIIAFPKGKTGSYTIPSTVKYLNKVFFDYEGLTGIVIPAGLTFDDWGLEFGVRGTLQKITVNSQNPEFSSFDGVVLNKNKTELVYCPPGKTGSFRTPETVETFGEWFSTGSLSSIYIPSKVKYVRLFGDFLSDQSPFGEELQTITVSKDNLFYASQNGLLMNYDKTRLMYIPKGMAGVLTIPEGTKIVDQGVLNGLTQVNEIHIPASVMEFRPLNNNYDYYGETYYSDFVFCPKLKAFVVDPENQYYSSMDGVLYNKGNSVTLLRCPCSKEAVTQFPSALRYIDVYAFHDCYKLTDFHVPSGVVLINGMACEDCVALKTLTIPASVTTISTILEKDINRLYRLSAYVDDFVDGDYRNVVIYGVPRSEAQRFAVQNNLTFKEITMVNTSTLRSDTIYIGSSLSIKCKSTDSEGEVQYAVFVRQGNSTEWKSVRGYAAGTSVLFKPTAIGTYTIRVKAKDSAGHLAVKDLTATVKGSELKNTSTLREESIYLSSRLTVKCKSTGGIGTVQYAIYMQKSGKTEWTKIKDYTQDNTVRFIPSETGTYTIKVKAKDTTGKISVKELAAVVKPSEMQNTSTVNTDTIKAGESVMIHCTSYKGVGVVLYTIYYKSSTQSNWTRLQDYTPASSAQLSLKKAGTYQIRVKAKDMSGKIASKDLTVLVR